MKKRKNIILILVSFLFFGHCLYYRIWYSLLFRSFISCCLYPFLLFYGAVSHHVFSWRQWSCDRGELVEQIRMLTKENLQLKADINVLHATEYYGQKVGDLVDFKQRYALQDAIIGSVLAAVCNEHEHIMLVTGGSREGIKIDMIALFHQAIIGRVIEVYPWYCKIRLITDAKSKVSAYGAKTGSLGIYYGHNNEPPTLEHVSHLNAVTEGEMIISSGKGLIFPEGFMLGTIRSVEKKELYYQIIINPVVDLDHISHCMILSKASCERFSVHISD